MRWKRLVVLSVLAPFLMLPSNVMASDQETQIGAQVYTSLQKKGEILSTSPYYSILRPIAARIKRIADPQYDYPFHFILVHEKDPNAFAVPGGNVYVTDSLMKFVENREELAGVLCHETSHDIHHDVVNNMAKDQRLQLAAGALSLLFGNLADGLASSAVNYAANIQSLTYSRKVETAADAKGSETCAEAGYNPWGMVWLFTHFDKADSHGQMEMLSDHPTNDHRVADLETHFRQNPALFSKYSSDIHTATKLPLMNSDKRAHYPSGTSSDQDSTPRSKPAIDPSDADSSSTSHDQLPKNVHNPSDNDVPRFP